MKTWRWTAYTIFSILIACSLIIQPISSALAQPARYSPPVTPNDTMFADVTNIQPDVAEQVETAGGNAPFPFTPQGLAQLDYADPGSPRALAVSPAVRPAVKDSSSLVAPDNGTFDIRRPGQATSNPMAALVSNPGRLPQDPRAALSQYIQFDAEATRPSATNISSSLTMPPGSTWLDWYWPAGDPISQQEDVELSTGSVLAPVLPVEPVVRTVFSTVYLPIISAHESDAVSIGLAPDRASVLTSSDERVVVKIPIGAVASNGTASLRLGESRSVPGFNSAGLFFELYATDAYGRPVLQFQRDFTVKLRYTPTAGLAEDRLALYYWKNNAYWQRVTSTVNPQTHEVVATLGHFSTFALLSPDENNWAVGNIVGLCKGTHIHEGPGLPVHTIVPEDNWLVKVIGGPRIYDGRVWWDTSRKAAGDPSGGTGWVMQEEADNCLGGGGGGGGGDWNWAVDELIGLCAGTEIRHGPLLAVHTIVPENDWTVKIIDGPRVVNGSTWWDTSRKAAGDPSGGTGWVSQEQAEAACSGPGGGGYIGSAPLSAQQRALLRMLGPLFGLIAPFLAGDPVYPPTGNLVQHCTDLHLPGVAGFDFDLVRTCNSLDKRDGKFGTGCSSLLDTGLRLANDGTLDVRYPDGHGAYFMVQNDAYVPGNPGILDVLTYTGAGFELTTPQQVVYVFDGQGNLLSLRDRHNNTISLERNGDQVTAITAAGGRVVHFTYDGDHVTAVVDPSGRTLGYGYSDGDLVSFTDGRGGVHRTEYQDHRPVRLFDPANILYLQNLYDDQGRVIEQIDASGSRSHFDYSTPGQVTYADNLGHQTVFTFDDRSRVTARQDALAHSEGFTYDDGDNLISYTDKRGNAWGYTYDARGNRLSENGPNGRRMAYTYNNTNDLTGSTDGLDRTTQYHWENGNLVRIDRPDGTALNYIYDGRGQVRAFRDAGSHVTGYSYDFSGNLVEVQSPLGSLTLYEYDRVGRLTGLTDGNAHTARFAYDGNDNLIRLTDPKGRLISFEYDPNDDLVKLIDRRGGVWQYAYDQNLKLVEQIDPVGHATRHGYDAMYNRTSTIDPRGNRTDFEYDELYRLTAVVDPLHQRTELAYDPNGNLVKVTNALTNETQFEYDALNQLALVTDALGGRTRYEYDAVGRVAQMFNPRDAETRYEYDALDRLRRMTDTYGGVTRYDYDADGNLIGVTDPNGHATYLGYDVDHRLTGMTDPEGHTTTYAHDGVGNVIRVVDARQNPTMLIYDENDNLVLVRDALNGETAFAYDEEDDLLSRTDPRHHVTALLRDRDGLVTRIVEPGGQVTRLEYDAAHNLTRLVNARGYATMYAYDVCNQLTTATDPLGHVTRQAYDALGRQITVTDPNGIVTRYEWDALGQLTAVVQNDQPGSPADHQTNVRTEYRYDEAGNLVKIADPNHHVTTFVYDLLDRLTREVNPLGKTWRYEYDQGGNLIRRVDANAQTTTYDYYADDLLAAIRYPNARSIAFEYDPTHNQIRLTDWLGTITNTFDALNRITSSTNHLSQTVGYSYDLDGNRTSVAYPDRRTVRSEYDQNDRVSRIIDPDGHIFVAGYDSTHNLTSILYPNLTRAAMTYDAAGRLTEVENKQDDGAVISRYRYLLDPAGNRTQSDEYYRWHQPREVGHQYTYDPLYRLVASQDSEGRSTQYVYDAASNRLQLRSNYDPQSTPTLVDPYTVDNTYNPANQLLSADHSVFGVTAYAYDNNGNRIRRQGPDVWTGSSNDILRTDYAYDFENRLTWTGTFRDAGNGNWQVRDESSMTYDGYGRLFRRMHDMHQASGGQKWTEFVYDGLDPIVEYVDPSPQYTNYYRGIGRILEAHDFKSQQSPDGTASFYHYDGLGSVSAMTKQRGQSAHEYTYWDYGMVLDGNDGAADSSNFTGPHNHYTYTGQEWEEYTRLYHFYAREYEPETGVWLQQDPYRGRLTEPATLHRYGYVADDPINAQDIYGFERGSAGGSEQVDRFIKILSDLGLNNLGVGTNNSSLNRLTNVQTNPNWSLRDITLKIVQAVNVADTFWKDLKISQAVEKIGRLGPELAYILKPLRSPIDFRLANIYKVAAQSRVTNTINKITKGLGKAAKILDVVTTPLRWWDYNDSKRQYEETRETYGEGHFFTESAKWDADYKKWSILPFIGEGIAVIKSIFNPKPVGGDCYGSECPGASQSNPGDYYPPGTQTIPYG